MDHSGFIKSDSKYFIDDISGFSWNKAVYHPANMPMNFYVPCFVKRPYKDHSHHIWEEQNATNKKA